MKRLLLVGAAVCAFAAMSTLSASAMPRATADTLVGDTDSPVIQVRGGMAMDTAIWAEAAAVTITVGAWAAIAGGTDQQTGAMRPTVCAR